MDWTTIINDMVAVESAPETQMKAQQTTLQTKNTAYQTIGTDLAALQKDVTTLMRPEFLRQPHGLRFQFLRGERRPRPPARPSAITLSRFRKLASDAPARAPPPPPIR